MKCTKCGAKLPNDTKFCSYCGTKIENNKITTANNFKTSWKNMNLFCKIVIVSTICFIVLFLKAFFAGKVIASIIALVSTILAIFALLTEMKIIKVSQKWIHIVSFILSVVIILPYANVYKPNRNGTEIDKLAVIDTTVSDNATVQATSTGGCTTENENSKTSVSDYEVYYADADSLEKALNNGAKVNGKVVKFIVNEYKPDSILGINCWAGEHLNFISDKELNVKKGSVIIGRITNEATNTLGSWKIPFEALSVSEESAKSSITTVQDTEATSDVEQLKITMKNSSRTYEGMDYLKVKNAFHKIGFSNISLVKISTENTTFTDGEVFSIRINGSSFDVGDTFEPEDKVKIKYYHVVEVSADENITIHNNSDFEAVLKTKNEFDPIIEQFANKYAGQTIEFDGYTANVTHSGDYKTRFDYLIYVGDCDSSPLVGPQFQIKDVNYYELHLTGNNVPNTLGEGLNIHIVAEVGTYNKNTGLFQIDPIRITMR